jgi:hypothetical protein
MNTARHQGGTVTGAQLAFAAECYASGRTLAEVAALVGWPPTTLRRRLIALLAVTPRRRGPRPGPRCGHDPYETVTRRDDGTTRCRACNREQARRRRGTPMTAWRRA